MKHTYFYLSLAFMTCNVTLSNWDFSPDFDKQFRFDMQDNVDGPTQTTEKETPILVVSKKKTELVKSFKEALGNLTQETKEKLEAIFAQNEAALTENQRNIKEAVTRSLVEYQGLIEQNSAAIEQNQQEMERVLTENQQKVKEAIAQAVIKYQATIEQNSAAVAQSQQEMKEAVAHALTEHQGALDQQKQKSEEEIAQIIGRYDNDKAEFIRTLLQQEEAQLDCINSLIVTGNRQKKLKNGFLICGGIALNGGVIADIFRNKFSQTQLISCVATGVVICGVAACTYGGCLPHKDTVSLEADAQNTRRKIEALKAMLTALQSKSSNEPEESAIPEKEVVEVIADDIEN